MPNNIYNNLSDDELKASYWYITHRVWLRKIGILVLTAVAGGLILYGAGGLLKYYVIDRSSRLAIETTIGSDRLNYNFIAEANKPQELVVKSTKVLKGAEGKVDIISEIYNPNQQWMVESFDYYYAIGEAKTDVKEDFILPEQNKLAIYLNYPSVAVFSEADLIIENVKWKKVAEFNSLREKVMQIEFENAAVSISNNSAVAGGKTITTVSFDAINKSVYNFWEPKIVILIYKGDTLVAVDQTVIDGLANGEKKHASVNLFQDISGAMRVELAPDINIMDSSVFKGFANEAGEVK